jgi:hypothetical protein
MRRRYEDHATLTEKRLATANHCHRVNKMLYDVGQRDDVIVGVLIYRGVEYVTENIEIHPWTFVDRFRGNILRDRNILRAD